jgi:hypothetical protein
MLALRCRGLTDTTSHIINGRDESQEEEFSAEKRDSRELAPPVKTNDQMSPSPRATWAKPLAPVPSTLRGGLEFTRR